MGGEWMGPKQRQGDYGHRDLYQITRLFPRHISCSCSPGYFSSTCWYCFFLLARRVELYFFFLNTSFSIPSPVVPDVWRAWEILVKEQTEVKQRYSAGRGLGGWGGGCGCFQDARSVKSLRGSCGVLTSVDGCCWLMVFLGFDGGMWAEATEMD